MDTIVDILINQRSWIWSELLSFNMFYAHAQYYLGIAHARKIIC